MNRELTPPAILREDAEKALVSRVKKLKAQASTTSWDLADAYMSLKEMGWTGRRIAQECEESETHVSRFLACAKKFAVPQTRPPFWQAYQEITAKAETEAVEPKPLPASEGFPPTQPVTSLDTSISTPPVTRAERLNMKPPTPFTLPSGPSTNGQATPTRSVSTPPSRTQQRRGAAAGDSGTNEGKPKNGAVGFDWKPFHSAYGVLVRAIDLLGNAYGCKETPAAEGLRAQLKKFESEFKSLYQKVAKQKAPE